MPASRPRSRRASRPWPPASTRRPRRASRKRFSRNSTAPRRSCTWRRRSPPPDTIPKPPAHGRPRWWTDPICRRFTNGSPARRYAPTRSPRRGRFSKPLAMVYGTFGRGREAVRTLERYLTGRHDDADAYYLAVQWLYTVRAAGASVHSPAEDLKLAHTYADAYAKAKGPQIALVRQWVDYLDKETKR